MATIITCKVDKINELLELQGGISFSYSANAIVNNPGYDKRITFGPVTVSPFSFSVMQPGKDTVKSLIQWVVKHEIKDKVTFQIKVAEFDAKSRDIELEKVCLESYSESVSETGATVSLAMVGQVVKVDGITVDQTTQR